MSLSPPLQSTARKSEEPPSDPLVVEHNSWENEWLVHQEKVLSWHEKRLERRLRGQYESSMLNLSEVLTSSMSTPIYFGGVRVTGDNLLSSWFTNSIVSSHLPKENPATLEAVLHSSRSITQALQSLDMHKAIKATLVPSTISPGTLDLLLTTIPRGRLFLRTFTEVEGDSNGSASVTASVRSPLGLGDKFSASYTYGTKTKKSFDASWTAPIPPGLGTRINIDVYGFLRDHTSYASCEEEVRGIKMYLRALSGRTTHDFGLSYNLRNIGGLLPKASYAIRAAAGPSGHASLFHTFMFDSRAYMPIPLPEGYVLPPMPASGAYLKTHTEVTRSFLKATLDSTISRGKSVTATFSWRSGILYSFSDNIPPFPDRFHVGGPTSLRAFRTSGAGVRSPCFPTLTPSLTTTDSAGSALFYNFGVSISSHLPSFMMKAPPKSVTCHIWTNAGAGASTLADTVPLTRPSISTGVGLVWTPNLPAAQSPNPIPANPLRIEVNLALPVVVSQGEATRKGIQFGLGVDIA